MHGIYRLVVIGSLLCATATAAGAQGDIRANQWSRGTTLNGFAGVASDATQTAPVFGGAVGWELTPNVAIEGSGSWLEFGNGTGAFSGALKVRGRLYGHRTIDPFVAGGVGLYRASFGPDESRMPDFYDRRMRPHMRAGGVGMTFTDPAVVGGAGVNIFLNRHFALRPDVEAMIVLRDRRSLVVTTVVLHAVYHFESHPVTPARRR